MSNTIIIAISYWIHLITTVFWLGSMIASAFVAFPAWKVGTVSNNQWLALQKKSVPLINISMVLIWITGFIQMTQDEQYTGFLSVDSTWAIAILLKHIAIFGMMGLALFSQFRIYPALGRLQLLAQKSATLAENETTALIKQEGRLLNINLVCACLVLLCTAVATAV